MCTCVTVLCACSPLDPLICCFYFAVFVSFSCLSFFFSLYFCHLIGQSADQLGPIFHNHVLLFIFLLNVYILKWFETILINQITSFSDQKESSNAVFCWGFLRVRCCMWFFVLFWLLASRLCLNLLLMTASMLILWAWFRVPDTIFSRLAGYACTIHVCRDILDRWMEIKLN